ncbi:MAG TPA: succinate--CoA ligase subunit alpha [Candidatus Lokiarchaeia archaeon]|nr:succinate--CoA ligase subunit alpha [Candidatus Lokiarchaeia archaeon]
MYVSEKSRVLVQGITGNQGSFHANLMLAYGTNIVAGTSPGKGGQEINGIPIFNTVEEAKDETSCDVSIVFVPAKFCFDAIMEDIAAGIYMTCIITEGIPIHDMVKLVEKARENGVFLVGPNCPGILIPDKIKLGIMPSDICGPGDVATISKSGTLSYEVTKAVSDAGFGVSAYLGIGGDPVRGTRMIDAVQYYMNDEATKSIVIIGEIGGNDEEKTAEFLKLEARKPVIAYIAGKSAPEGKRMGHAGAIISGSSGTAASKITALQDAGALIADTPWDVPELLKSVN